jgi:hypothetical protein
MTPFFKLIHKNVKSIAGSKGLSPLAGFGAEPQKNFAYTVPQWFRDSLK